MKRNLSRLLLPFLLAMNLHGPFLHAGDIASLTQKASDADSQGNLTESIADWTQVIQLDPKNARAYYNRGVSKDSQQDLNGAIADYTQAIQLDPKNAASHANRGYARYRNGDLPGAMLDYNQALALDPKDDETYNNRGNAKLALDDPDGAIADFNEAIRLDPHLAHAYNGRGNASLNEGDLDQAITDFNQALLLDPRYAHAYNGKGLAETAQRNFHSALDDFTQAITLNPQYAHAYLNRGFAYYDMGQLPRALQDFQKAAELDPFDLDTRLFIWLCTASQPGQTATANLGLKSFLQANNADSSWGSDLANFLMGGISQEQLLQLAKTADEKQTRQHQCEAYFYIGSKDELGGDPTDAILFYRRCVGTDQRDFNAYLVAQAQVEKAEPSVSSSDFNSPPPAVWINGQILLQNNILLFAADKPVRGNPLKNIVLLGCTRDTVKTLTGIYVKIAAKHLTVRLYGSLLPFGGTMPGNSGPLPTVQFITWKLHMPGDPDILPPSQRDNIQDPLPFE